MNFLAAGSALRIQFTTEERYQSFLSRSIEADVLGVRVKIAHLEDVTQGKLWAFSDPRRRLSKRKKDELDLIRRAEAYPHLKAFLPGELLDQLEGTVFECFRGLPRFSRDSHRDYLIALTQ